MSVDPRGVLVLAGLGLVVVGVTGVPPGLVGPAPGSSPGRIPVSEAGIDWRNHPEDGPPNGSARIRAVYPNPIAAGDVGEYLLVTLPPSPPETTWSVTDNESVATVPAPPPNGTVVLTTTPRVVRNRTTRPVVALAGRLSLTNGGERLTLRQNGSVVDVLSYPATGEYELYRRGRLRPRNVSAFPTWRTTDSTATVFVLPDDAAVPATVLRQARHRLYLAGYTLTSRRVVGLLMSAAARGVDVRVLLEGGPAGGMSQRTATLVPRLRAAGVTVRIVNGPRSRWRFHHAKYAVVDDRALVMSENWQPAGTGGRATRGWGTVLEDPTLADRLATVFTEDHGAAGAKPWPAVRESSAFQPPSPATGTFYPRFPAAVTTVDAAELLLAPDNAERRLLEVLRGATESIRVLQPTIGNRTPLLAALVNAARRGVSVRILLGGTWFMETENAYLRDRLRRIAAREGLPLRVRLIEPRSRFEYLHAKGVLVDGDQVVVGSINWNTVSTRQNREVAVLLEGEQVAQYYRRVFTADWRGAAWRLPVGTAAIGVVTVVVVTTVLLRTVRFGGRPGAPRRARRRPSSRRARRERDPASRERT